MMQQSILEPVGHGAYRHAVNRQLLAQMLRGKFAAGQRLILGDLARQLDVSVTPVREAMLDLAGLGMVEFQPNRGAMARVFGADELLEIYQLRRIMEVEATRGACGRIPQEQLRWLKAQLDEAWLDDEPQSSATAIRTDVLLHELIAEYCGSRRLREEIQRYDILMQAVREVLGNRNRIQTRAAQEHQQIVRAIMKNDREKAAALMANHIERTGHEVAEILWPRKDASNEG